MLLFWRGIGLCSLVRMGEGACSGGRMARKTEGPGTRKFEKEAPNFRERELVFTPCLAKTQGLGCLLLLRSGLGSTSFSPFPLTSESKDLSSIFSISIIVQRLPHSHRTIIFFFLLLLLLIILFLLNIVLRLRLCLPLRMSATQSQRFPCIPVSVGLAPTLGRTYFQILCTLQLLDRPVEA